MFHPYRQIINEDEKVLLLNPGHGGIVDGVYVTAPDKMFDHGEFQFFEGVFNRQIVDKLIALMYLEDNFEVIVNTQEDIPFWQRPKLANDIQEANPNMKYVLFSIHGNADVTGTAEGIEVYTSPGYTKSDDYAAIAMGELEKIDNMTFRYGSPKKKDKEARFNILTETTMSSILFELGFFTNKEECKKMLNVDHQWRYARALHRAWKIIKEM